MLAIFHLRQTDGQCSYKDKYPEVFDNDGDDDDGDDDYDDYGPKLHNM